MLVFFFYFSKPKLDVILNPVYQPDDQPLGENPQSIDRKNVVYKEVNDDLVQFVLFVILFFSNLNEYIRIMKI